MNQPQPSDKPHMRELRRDYQSSAREAAENAYDEEMQRW